MLIKIILCATNNKLIAGVWRMGKLQSHQVFTQDEQSYNDFTQFLKLHKKTRFYLLADAIEEDYRLETLPHATGAAKNELVERKLTQLYRHTNYRVAHFIERETENRKDDRYLMAALTNTDFLQTWISLITAEQVPLVGVYLLPMMSQELVRSMKLKVPDLLLSERLSSGLRQTYFSQGRLRISRLAPMTQQDDSKLGYFYLVETEKTRLYLISQRLIARETKFTMVVPAHDDSCQSICRDITQETGIECVGADIAQLAQGLNLEPQLLRENPELLHMHLLAIGSAPDSIAPPALTKPHKINNLRLSILTILAAVIFTGLVLSAMNWIHAKNLASQTEQDKIATETQMRLYDEVAKNFPKTNFTGTDLQTAVELAKHITQYKAPPTKMLQTISHAIELSPEIYINRINYLRTNELDPKDNDKQDSHLLPNHTTPAASDFTPDPTQLYEVAFVDGEISRFNGDYRAALEKVNQLAERLKTSPAVAQVIIVQAPVNASSYTNLQGSTTDNMAEQQSPATFKLRITLKNEVPAP